jgi:uncharacterized membrane protein YccC
MPKFDRWTLLFSVNSFAAAMLALYIGFALGLPRPYWAMTTAYIVSQPLAGAVRSKAVYRLLGTLLGAAAAVAMVPNLVNAPVLLCLAMALWVGGCLTVSLLDRTPRSYILMLAGYTAAIIGFPAVNQPGGIFEIAVSRVIEIGLGILCATLVHSLVFPRPVGTVLRQRLAAWLGEADRWALDVLKGRDADALDRDRRHLAAAASEIHLLAVHLPFDTSRLRETTGAVRAFHDRMLLLIPLLSGLADRMEALKDVADPAVREALDAVAAWIEAGAPREPGLALVERLQALAAARRDADWSGLLIESLLVRLAEAVQALGEAHALMVRLCDPDAPLSPALETAAATAGRRKLHADLPLALLSGGAAVIAILLSCLAWIGFGWGDGAAAPVMGAVFCCFFAAMDDPVPAIKNFGLYSLFSLPLAALYMFAVLPAIDGFPLLLAVMAPPLVFLGLYIPNPKTMGAALAVIMGFANALALQESFSADFASFLNGNLGQFVGLLAAIMVTAGLRSMGADASARRLLGRTWTGLARLARAKHRARADRLRRRAGRSPGPADPQAGRGQSAWRSGRRRRPARPAGRHEPGRRPGRTSRPRPHGQPRRRLGRGGPALRRPGRRSDPAVRHRPADARLDAALRDVAGAASDAQVQGVTGLVGLRRNLFPDAPAPNLLPEPAQ